MKYLAINALAIVCVIGAAVLMWYDKDGWGWLIAIAIVTSHAWEDKDD